MFYVPGTNAFTPAPVFKKLLVFLFRIFSLDTHPQHRTHENNNKKKK